MLVIAAIFGIIFPFSKNGLSPKVNCHGCGDHCQKHFTLWIENIATFIGFPELLNQHHKAPSSESALVHRLPCSDFLTLSNRHTLRRNALASCRLAGAFGHMLFSAGLGTPLDGQLEHVL
jgi:hypothetical protein